MTLTTRNLSRIIWIHVREREGDLGKEDLLAKLLHRLRKPADKQHMRQHAPWVRGRY